MASKTPSTARSHTPGPSPQGVLQTLAWVRQQGFKPVPLQPGTKAAAVKDYMDPGYKPPSDDHWQARLLDIGVALGPSHGGPVDIDLDCDEAVMLAPRFLPSTRAVFGRPSKPRSHFVYKCAPDDPLLKVAYNDPLTRKTIVELRADGGHQTVFPGSTHEGSGELIAWSDVPFPDVPLVAAEDIEKAVKRLAVACLIARYLWDPGTRNENNKHICGMFYYMGWTLEEVEHLISAVQDFHGDEDKTRIKTLHVTWKRAERGAKVTGATSLKKAIPADRHPVVDKILELIGAQENSILMEYNERFACVRDGTSFRIMAAPDRPGQPPYRMTKDCFLDFYGNEKVAIGEKMVSKGRLWLANPQRRSYDTTEFAPGQGELDHALNTWTGWAVAPDADASCEQWVKLLREVVCGKDKKLFEWMMNWFAGIIQEPGLKPLTAPVIIGKPGAGKSVLVDYVGKLLGSAYMVVTNAEHVVGKFNAHLGTTLLLHSAEALYGGEKKHRGTIKSLITDTTHVNERKGVDAEVVKSYLRLIMTSNETHAAPVEANDRRFTVIDLKDRKMTKDHVKKLVEEMNGGGPAALMHKLMNWPYDPQLVRTNIVNNDHATMKMRGVTKLESWWMEALENGNMLPTYLSYAQRGEHDPWPHTVSSPILHQVALMYLKNEGERFLPSANEFANKIAAFTGGKFKKKQTVFKTDITHDVPLQFRGFSHRMNAYVDIPPLEECRKIFEKYLGGEKVTWVTDKEDLLPHEKDTATKPKGKAF